MKEPLILTEEDGGTPAATVTYEARKGEKPVFYAGLALEGFTKVNDKLWKLQIPEVIRYNWYFEQLYVNGKRATRAKFPNEGFFKPRYVTETRLKSDTDHSYDLYGDKRFHIFALQQIALFPEQAALLYKLPPQQLQDAVFTFYHKWDNTRKKISWLSMKNTSVYMVGRGMQAWNRMNEETLFTIENVQSALDAPGEWFLEKKTGTLYYIPREGEKLSGLKCFAPAGEQFIIIRGTENKIVQNLRFINISFYGGGYTMPNEGNDPVQAAAFIEATIMADYAKNIEIINCEIAHTGTNAIWFRKHCADSKIEHCYLHDLGAGGVKLGEIKPTGTAQDITHHITIDNNILHSGGYVFPCAVGVVIFTASDNTVTHNDIADFQYTGVSVGWVWGYTPSYTKRNTIDFNHIHHLGWGVLSDMGGVYTLGLSEGTTVSNNVIHHIYAYTYGGWGLYTDEGSTGISMENNLVYACKSSAFHQHFGKGNIIRNNIFAMQIRAQLEATRTEDHIGFSFTNNIIYYNRGNLAGINWDKVNFLSDYNCYWDTRGRDIQVKNISFEDWQKTGKDIHSIIADPGFIDPSRNDFRLKDMSVASRINFKPFDYSKAGVYGDKAWKDLARLDPAITAKFDEMVNRMERENPIK